MKFIPVRGRKHDFYFCPLCDKPVEIYPREGTETTLPQTRFPSLLVEIYPREGTETFLTHKIATHDIKLKFIPREGTETGTYGASNTTVGLKFIPVRGRKHDLSKVTEGYHTVEIYPREGTETTGSGAANGL